MQNVYLPNVTHLGESVFSGCTSLENVSFGDNCCLERLPDFAFENCTSLEGIFWNSNCSVKSIGEKAFYASAIKSITIPEGVEEIGNQAFAECEELLMVYIAEFCIPTINESTEYLFSNCEKLFYIFVFDPNGFMIYGYYQRELNWFEHFHYLECITEEWKVATNLDRENPSLKYLFPSVWEEDFEILNIDDEGEIQQALNSSYGVIFYIEADQYLEDILNQVEYYTQLQDCNYFIIISGF